MIRWFSRFFFISHLFHISIYMLSPQLQWVFDPSGSRFKSGLFRCRVEPWRPGWSLWCFSLLVAGCWLKYNYTKFQDDIHPSIHLWLFFPLGFPVPLRQRRLAPCDPLSHLPRSPTRHRECSRLGVGLNGLVAGGWWLVEAPQLNMLTCVFSFFEWLETFIDMV